MRRGDAPALSRSPCWARTVLCDVGSYSLTGTSSSDFSDSEAGNDDTGNYSLTTSSTDGSTYTRTGTDFSILQSDNDSGSVTTTGNDYSGDYTATAIGADTVVTSQTDSGTDAETLSQTSTNSSTLTNTGNDYTGDFTTTGTENLATTLDAFGSNYGGGSYSLHETSSDAPALTLTGNDIDGTQDTTQTGDETYSLSQTDSGGLDGIGYTLNETGDKSYTLTGSDDANTGDSTTTETGTDDYTLSETNITGDYSPDDDSDFSPDIGLDSTVYEVTDISVSGTEDYTIVTSANSQSGDFSQSFTGGGDYDRTESGTETISDTGSPTSTEPFSTEDSGSTDINDTQTGDTRDGDVTLTADGTDRYSLLFGFNNPSNGAQGTSGIADYSPVGLPVLVRRMSVPAGIFSDIGDDRYDYCFAAGTLVLMADGTRKAIEKVEAGEMVLAAPDTDPEAEPSPCRVMEVYHNPPARLLAVYVAEAGDVTGGAPVFTTAEHRFYVVGKGWTKAAELRPGDRLRASEGARAAVRSTRVTSRTEPVFNLRVAGSRTYFVWQSNVGSLLVHNDSAGTVAPSVKITTESGSAVLTPQQLKAFQAASAIIPLRATQASADGAVMSWLKDHPSTAFDAPPEQRAPANLMAAMNAADQAVQEAEDAYNSRYGDVDTGFTFMGGDVINDEGGGKGVDAAVKAVTTLGRLGPDRGMTSDVTPCLVAVTPGLGQLLSAGASAEGASTVLPDAIATTARASVSEIDEEVARNVGKILDDASIKAAREYAAANPGAYPRVFEAVYDPATGEVAAVGRSGLVPAESLSNVTGAQSSALIRPWQACALPKAANEGILAAGEDGGLFGSNGGFKVVDGDLYFQAQCKNCELFYQANPALAPAAPMFNVPVGTPAFPVAGPNPWRRCFQTRQCPSSRRRVGTMVGAWA
jgi:hypothetical protein